MTLEELIERLKQVHPARIIPHGFQCPHSYRGDYFAVAFEPVVDVTAGSMLRAAESAMGHSFVGWKGGEYTMGPHTEVYLAEEGCCGEQLGPSLLNYMLAEQ